MEKQHLTPTVFERATEWVGSPSSVVVHTSAFVLAFFIGIFGFAPWDMVLLVLTTIVSLEAIYLAIFIQMTVNRNTRDLQEVSEDIDEIQEDVEEISEDVEDIQEDIDEIQEDVDEIQEDVEEISEDESEDAKPAAHEKKVHATLESLASDMKKILAEIEALKQK